MTLPFTVEQFFAVFRTYNSAIWPAQLVAYGLGALIAVLMVRRSPTADRIVAAVLAAFWLWTGMAYHLAFFSRINQAAYGFGVLFLIEGLLLLVFGTVRRRLSFQSRWDVWSLLGGLLIFYAAIVYPLLGVFFGHPLVEIPWLGVTPCPTTIFTFGALLCVGTGRPLVLTIPLLWSVVGGSAAVLLQVPQDYGLIAAGIIGFVSLLVRAGRQGAYHTAP
jgi:hypothetical protein